MCRIPPGDPRFRRSYGYVYVPQTSYILKFSLAAITTVASLDKAFYDDYL